jgi:RNA polymerase sigma-70 factor (ECF subfamily)
MTRAAARAPAPTTVFAFDRSTTGSYARSPVPAIGVGAGAFQMSDENLRRIEAWQIRHDEDAARELIAALYPQVSRIARRHLPFRMAEEDLVQEIFAKLFQNLHRYDVSRPLKNWVSRVAVNLCRDQLRARTCRPELRWSDLTDGEQRAMEATLAAVEPEGASIAKEARALLGKLLETLNADDRMVLTLLHLEEKTVDEIVALTGWNRTLVKVRSFRARARMRQALEAMAFDRER